MSSRPAAASDTAISSARVVSPGLYRFALKYLDTRRLDPRDHLLMAASVSYMVEALSGAI